MVKLTQLLSPLELYILTSVVTPWGKVKKLENFYIYSKKILRYDAKA